MVQMRVSEGARSRQESRGDGRKVGDVPDLSEHVEVIDDPAREELRALLVPTRQQWARVLGRVAPHSRRRTRRAWRVAAAAVAMVLT